MWLRKFANLFVEDIYKFVTDQSSTVVVYQLMLYNLYFLLTKTVWIWLHTVPTLGWEWDCRPNFECHVCSHMGTRDISHGPDVGPTWHGHLGLTWAWRGPDVGLSRGPDVGLSHGPDVCIQVAYEAG